MTLLFKARNYVNEYAKTLGANTERISDYNYRLKLPDGDKLQVIVKTRDNIAWDTKQTHIAFYRTFSTLSSYFQRLIANYRLASILGIGPIFHGYEIVDNEALIIITEYLPIKISKDLAIKNKEIITAWVQKIHALGIYHGDLYGNNLRLNSKYEIYMIDFETMFFEDEKDLPIVVKWLVTNFEMTFEEYILYEAQENFLLVTDED
jgi:tRNA A-37 threonylcarbamoyl transferase component Bud32